MQKNKKFSCYNDGVVNIYRPKESDKQTNFSATKNVTSLDDMEYIVKLAYEEAAKREQDIDFANQNDFTLSLKVKTRLFKPVDNKCMAVIDGYLYSVSHIDKNRSEMWLYLQGVRSLDS